MAASLSDGLSYVRTLTPGFTPASGIRGYIPKDLWVAVTRRDLGDKLLGMPQLYVILSDRGIEVGLAAAIHPRDFSNASLKERLRAVVPKLFRTLPEASSELVSRIDADLQSMGAWRAVQKARQDPSDRGDFASVSDLFRFLQSPRGESWGAGGVCQYLDHEYAASRAAGARETLGDLAGVFTPLFEALPPARQILEETSGRERMSDSHEVSEALETFMSVLDEARSERPFREYDDLSRARRSVVSGIRNLPPLTRRRNWLIESSVGYGEWSRIPWLSIMDPAVTRSTQEGIYVVLLFPEDLSGLYLCLGQGVTAIAKEHGRRAREVLARRATFMSRFLHDLERHGFSIGDSIDLRSDGSLARRYQDAVVASKFISREDLPSDAEWSRALGALLDAYESIDFDGLPDSDEPLTTEHSDTSAASERDMFDLRPGQRVWLLAPGERASHWDQFYRDGIAAIGWDEIGDFRDYPDEEAMSERIGAQYGGDTDPGQVVRMCYDFIHAMNPGDLIFAKRGRSEIVGYGEITGEYFYDERAPIYRNRRTTRWIDMGSWPTGSMLAMKTLTDITTNSELVQELIDIVRGEAPYPSTPPEELPTYTNADALADLFLSSEEFSRIKSTWLHKRNVILQGPPGVGKTYVSKRLAYALMGFKDDSRIGMVQFHQSYSYEDFVQGFRPTEDGFALRDGLFFEFCERARKDPEHAHVFIIDEINRGNLSKTLGELMMLIEPDKRSAEWAVPLAYASSLDEPFFVPPNLYLLGLMNTADRSLSMVDYALRRRFAFAELKPEFVSEKFTEHLRAHGVSHTMIEQIASRMTELNEHIAEDTVNLGRGFCIGHSFFCGARTDEETEEEWFARIIETEILPLLEEYFYGQPAAPDWRGMLLG